jgi:upstream activation factor subunit UAF30
MAKAKAKAKARPKAAKKAVKKVVKKVAKPKAAKKPKVKRKASGGGLTSLVYSVTPELEAIIETKKATRPQIVKKLWAYIKAKKLQDVKNKRMINTDDKLAAIFGTKQVHMLKMAGMLSKHIKK